MNFKRLNPYYQEHLVKVDKKVIQKQLEIEKLLEHTLRQEGYTPFSIEGNRDKIRRLLFWPNGTKKSLSSLYNHEKEMLKNWKESFVFRHIKKMLKKGELTLERNP